MVERRPALTFLAHLVLVLGVVVVAFPLYIAFVASTYPNPMPVPEFRKEFFAQMDRLKVSRELASRYGA